MMMRNLYALISLALCSLLLSGCALLEPTQTVTDVQQHPDDNVTLIQTYESGLLYEGTRFWHCSQQNEELVCDRVCGDEVKCPQNPGVIRADRSPDAQRGSAFAGGAPAQPAEPTPTVEQEPAIDEDPAEDEELAEDEEPVEDEELAIDEDAEEPQSDDAEEEQ